MFRRKTNSTPGSVNKVKRKVDNSNNNNKNNETLIRNGQQPSSVSAVMRAPISIASSITSSSSSSINSYRAVVKRKLKTFPELKLKDQALFLVPALLLFLLCFDWCAHLGK